MLFGFSQESHGWIYRWKVCNLILLSFLFVFLFLKLTQMIFVDSGPVGFLFHMLNFRVFISMGVCVCGGKGRGWGSRFTFPVYPQGFFLVK